MAMVVLVWLSMTLASYAQTKNSYPMLMSLKPTAAQIGQSTEHELSARYNLAGATTVIVAGKGVTCEVLRDEKEKPEDRTKNDVMASKCKLRFTVAADVIPGVRDFRVFTPHGVSTLGQLVITRDPVVVEAAENNTKDKAQSVAIPVTLCGTIEKAEDVDWYKFDAAANTSLVFHVRAQRLLNRMHDMQTRIDPMITLRDAQGATLASSDNVYAGDPLLHFNVPSAGEYLLEVRDVRYQGNADWIYSIEVNDRPFVKQVDPPVVIAGANSKLHAIGFNVPPSAQMDTTIPTGTDRIVSMASTIQGLATNDFPVFVLPSDSVPIVRETNRDSDSLGSSETKSDGTGGKSNDTGGQTPFAVPSVLTGTIAAAGETDRFVFEAKAKEAFSFEVIARRLRSDIDPKIRIINEKGVTVTEADDATFQRVNHADAWLENWSAPSDGKFVLEVLDLHQRGGPGFTYAVQAVRAEPYFMLEADTDKTLLAPGMGSVLYVRGLRRNGFAGEIQLEVSGLPAGVTAIAGRIAPELNDGIVYLEASPDAPQGAANIQVIGRSSSTQGDGSKKELSSTASILQEYYSPGGGRGHYPVEMHTVSVAEPVDIRQIRLSADEIRLKPGESKRIDIDIQRAPDFTGNVTLDMLYQHLEQPHGNSLPKGVTVDVPNSKTLLTGADSKGHITIKAAADAPAVTNQLVPINVHISINFVMKHTFCPKPIKVTVEK